MLRDLHVRNLAVLAGASVELGPGLNVLTGETGAGKSIVVDSLALLGGARASAELIRTGAETLSVTGVFTLEAGDWQATLAAAGLEAEGGELVVRREIGREGRNRVFVNDQPTTLRLLAELAPALLRIHGQREELGLAAPDLQRAWLDRSGGEDAPPLGEACAAAFAAWRQLADRLARLDGDERLRQERVDLLRFQLGEIDRVAPRAGEEVELRARREALRHAEAIHDGLSAAFGALSEDEGAAVERLAQARAALAAIAEWESAAREALAELEELAVRAEETARTLRDRLETAAAEPGALDALEERLALVERLLRKHGTTCAEVIERRAAMAAELAELEEDAANRDDLAARAAAALADYRRAALALSASRAAWGEALSTRLAAELHDLALPKARFAVKLERRRRSDSPLHLDGEAVDFGAYGIDQVVFEFSPNPGEALRPLAKVASGGELARVYLALQLAARGEAVAGGPALVFDEVDAGIGGAEAAALGRKLQRLARRGQILAVTHLPQVASCADQHFRVGKRVEGGRTYAEVERLDAAQRVEEIARMLAGRKVTALSRSHAEELIASAAGGRR